MPKKNKYPGLTAEQRTKLKALLAELVTHPTDNLLVECIRLREPDLEAPAGRGDVDRAMASAWAYERLMPYMLALRYFSGERRDIGRQIYDYMQVPYPKQDSEVEAKAYADLVSSDLAGVQEITFHFFCVTVKHVLTCLTNAAESIGHEIRQRDIDFLDHYRELRDYYEHFYNRLPGRTHDYAVVTKTLSSSGYLVQGGLKVDAQQRLLIKVPRRDDNGKPIKGENGEYLLEEKPFAVNDEGMRRINEIVERNWRHMRKKAIDGLREYFVANPEKIPSPDDVRFELMTRPGGYVPED